MRLLYATAHRHAKRWPQNDPCFAKIETSGLLKFAASMSVADRPLTLKVIYVRHLTDDGPVLVLARLLWRRLALRKVGREFASLPAAIWLRTEGCIGGRYVAHALPVSDAEPLSCEPNCAVRRLTT